MQNQTDHDSIDQLHQTCLALKRTIHALTEEKLAIEIRAQKLARANDALQAVIDAMPDIRDMDELVPIALRIVALAFGSSDCSYYEHFEGCPIQVRYWCHDGRILLPHQLPEVFSNHDGVLQQLVDGFMVPDDYLGAHYRQRTRAALIWHDRGTAVDRFDAFAMANGWGPELNVPVVDNGKADATMVILRPFGTTFSKDEVELAETLAKQLSLAMQTGRLAARARETAIAYEQAARLGRTNAALKRTTEQLVAYADLDQFMCTLLEEAVASAGAVGGVFHLYWPERQELERRAVIQRGVSMKPRTEPHAAHLKAPISTLNNPVWDELNARRELTWLDCHDPRVANEPRTRLNLSLGHRHVATIPMVNGADLIGFIGIAFDQSVVSRPHDSVLDVAQVLAQQATLAVRLTRLSDAARDADVSRMRELATRQRVARLEAANQLLSEGVEALATGRELPGLIASILTTAKRQTAASVCMLHLLDQASDTLQFSRARMDGLWFERTQAPVDLRFADIPSISECAPWRQLQNQKISLLQVTEFDDAFTAARTALYREAGCAHLAWIPLRAGNQIKGIIELAWATSGTTLDLEQTELLLALAQQLTLSLELTAIEARLRDTEVRAAVDAERARMAREIHDSLAQSFGSIAMQSDALLANSGEDARTRRTLERIMQTARAGMAEARATALALMPQENRAGALDEALKGLAERSTITDRLLSHFDAVGTAEELPFAVQDTLLRIAQEAINNAIRHAAASRIDVQLTYHGHAVQMSISDNGKGIEQVPESGSGMGLKGMRHRANSLDGTFHIGNAEQGGTRLEVLIPLARGA